jgi:leucyl-tRNA---protein transferase
MAPLNYENNEEVHDALNNMGFRRSHDMVYRPACKGCSACISVRIVANDFKINESFGRIIDRNRDLIVVSLPPKGLREHFELFNSYLRARHHHTMMIAMGFDAYCQMVEESPIRTGLSEFRGQDGKLYGVCLIDYMADGLSMVYSFFDAKSDKRSLGSYMILWHIQQATLLQLPYVYLGYWVEGSQKMGYKIRFKPLQMLVGNRWETMPP